MNCSFDVEIERCCMIFYLIKHICKIDTALFLFMEETKMGTKFGYVRVSSNEQNEDRQLRSMRNLGLRSNKIFIDKQSGKDFERPEYKKMLKKLKSEDVLYVESIDRLGRNYREIIEQWRYLTKELNVDIVVVDMPILDTRRGKDLMETFLSDIVLALLSYVAENERINIRKRQKAGIAAAKSRGVKFGRPSKPLPDNFNEIYIKWNRKELLLKEAAAKCNMSSSTFLYKARKYSLSIKR